MGWLEVWAVFGGAPTLERGRENQGGRSVHGAGARGPFVLGARTKKEVGTM